MAKQQNPQHQKIREHLIKRHENKVAHREEVKAKRQAEFVEPLTGPKAQHIAKAYAGAEYQPVVRGIRQELAQSRAQQHKERQGYNQLGSEMAGAAAANEQANAAYSTSLTQQLAQANAQNAQTLATQQAANQQFAATTGMPMPASSGQAAAAGANIGALDAVALNAPVQAAGAAQSGYLRNVGIAQKQQGLASVKAQYQNRRKIRQDLGAAQKQKGQAYVGRLNELRESAKKDELDKKAFMLEGQEAQAQQAAEQQKIEQSEVQDKRSAATSRAGQQVTAADSAASTAASREGNAISAQNAETDRQKANREQREYQQEQHYKKSHGGRTPAEVAANRKEGKPSTSEVNNKREAIQEGRAAASQAIRALGKSPKTFSPAEWLALEQHLTAPQTGKEPGAGLPAQVAARVVRELRQRYAGPAHNNSPGPHGHR